MSGNVEISELVEETSENPAPTKNEDSKEVSIKSDSSAIAPSKAEIERNLLAADRTGKNLLASAKLLDAAKFEPPPEFYANHQLAPQGPGLFETLKDLPREVIISSVAVLGIFLAFLATTPGFLWFVGIVGGISLAIAGMNYYVTSQVITVSQQIETGRGSMLQKINTARVETAVKMKEKTAEMHSKQMETIKEVVNIRGTVDIRLGESRAKIVALSTQKDVRIKELTEDGQTTRSRLTNEHSKLIADIEANSTEKIQQLEHETKRIQISSEEKTAGIRMKTEMDKTTLEQETARKNAELQREQENTRLKNERKLTERQIDADKEKHEMTLKNEAELTKLKLAEQAAKTRDEINLQIRLAEEETEREKLKQGCICV